MTLVKGCLRCFVQKPRRRSGKISVLQLKLSAGVKRDGAQSLRTRPTVGRGGRNRLIERPQRRRRRNFVQNLGRIPVNDRQLAQTCRRGVSKIRLRKSIDVLPVI